jgi:thioredoxin reductase (NADPH)
MLDLSYLVYAVPAALLCAYFWRRSRRRERLHSEAHRQSLDSGMTEPASLHPVIDIKTCIGCEACVKACPEEPLHHVLGIIQGKATLISPTDCIGHGACKVACPVGAITLVFGSAKRGVDIPVVSPTFESSVPGIYVAGELGGMGLIRNALEQGRQAVEVIAKGRRRKAGRLDLVIVGAGPAGFAASLTATQQKLQFITIEQESLGGCVFQYPRAKLVMTAPAILPLVGKMQFKHTSKEKLLEFWQHAEQRAGLKIRYRERVEQIQSADGGFVVTTQKQVYSASNVLLAIGRRGTPRKLGVPGEELPKVVYRLLDPEQYRGQSVIVVGGGDSALEAAVSIAEQPDTQVILSYRGAVFDRAKPLNRQRVDQAAKARQLKVLMGSKLILIEPDRVNIEVGDRSVQVRNDAVIISAGGILPTEFLRKVGLEVATKYGTA